jgi:hypothetical protein
MTYLMLLFIAFVSLYVSKSCLIWILREGYKDTYISLGSPSMLSQYPFFVLGLIFSSDFMGAGVGYFIKEKSSDGWAE